MSRRRKKLLLEIEIKFGKGKSDVVLVYEGDHPLDLAEDFVDKHRLKPTSIPIIREHIENTLADAHLDIDPPDSPRSMASSFEGSMYSADHHRRDESLNSSYFSSPEGKEYNNRRNSRRGSSPAQDDSFFDSPVAEKVRNSSVTSRLDSAMARNNAATSVSTSETSRSVAQMNGNNRAEPVLRETSQTGALSERVEDSLWSAPLQSATAVAREPSQTDCGRDSIDDGNSSITLTPRTNHTESSGPVNAAPLSVLLPHASVRSLIESTDSGSKLPTTALKEQSEPESIVSKDKWIRSSEGVPIVKDSGTWSPSIAASSSREELSYNRLRTNSMTRRQLYEAAGMNQNTASIFSPEYYLSGGQTDPISPTNSVTHSFSAANNTSTTSTAAVEDLVKEQNQKTVNVLEHSYQTGDLSSSRMKSPSFSVGIIDVQRQSSSMSTLTSFPTVGATASELPPHGTHHNSVHYMPTKSSRSSTPGVREDRSTLSRAFSEELVDPDMRRPSDALQYCQSSTRMNSNSTLDRSREMLLSDTHDIDDSRRARSMSRTRSPSQYHTTQFNSIGNTDLSSNASSLFPHTHEPEISTEEAEMDYYNRLKQEAKQMSKPVTKRHAPVTHKPQSKPQSGSQSLVTGNPMSLSASALAITDDPDIRPSSNVLQFSKNKSSLTSEAANAFNKRSGSVLSIDSAQYKDQIIGKTAHERLYHSASLQRKQQSIREEQKRQQEAKQLEKEQFKLNEQSRRITEEICRHRPSSGGIAGEEDTVNERLYQKGMKEIQSKEKIEREAEKTLKEIKDMGENWSCSRCGTFFAIQQNVASHSSKSRKLYGTEQARVCTNCGFNQSELKPHQPLNIAMRLAKDSGASVNAEELLHHRNQVVQELSQQQAVNGSISVLGSGGGSNNDISVVHEYLYRAKREDATLQNNLQLWQEIHSDHTFHPVIPKSSKQILKKYRQPQPPLVLDENSELQPQDHVEDDVSLMSSDNHHGDHEGDDRGNDKKHAKGSNRLKGDDLREYINKPAVERLTVTTTVQLREREKENDRMKKIKTKSQAFTKMTSGSITKPVNDPLINRLYNEHKTKEQKLKKSSDRAARFDISTGRELFKPHVNAVPEGILPAGEHYRNKNQDIWTDILQRDADLQSRKRALQKKAVEKSLQELKANQVKALPSSNDILQKATDKNLQELFKLLVVSSLHDDLRESDVEGHESAASADEEQEAQSVAEMYQQAMQLTDWRERELDLLRVNPHFVINEVSTLLADMQAALIVQSKRHLEQSTESLPMLMVNFDQFAKLASKCIRQRDGPGKGYVYAPKKKPELALEHQRREKQEETFQPEIDKTSLEILQKNSRQIRSLALPIETILQADGERVRSKVEQQRQQKVIEEASELTFKPTLYKPPSYVVPRYRGMNDVSLTDDVDTESFAVSEEDDSPPVNTDANSLANFASSASNLKTFAIPFGESEGQKMLQSMLRSGNAGVFIRGGGNKLVVSGGGPTASTSANGAIPSPLQSPLAATAAVPFSARTGHSLSLSQLSHNPHNPPFRSSPSQFISPPTQTPFADACDLPLDLDVHSMNDRLIALASPLTQQNVAEHNQLQQSHNAIATATERVTATEELNTDHYSDDFGTLTASATSRARLDSHFHDSTGVVSGDNRPLSTMSGTDAAGPPLNRWSSTSAIVPTDCKHAIHVGTRPEVPLEKQRSSSPDMSTFSDNTISTKFSIDASQTSKLTDKSATAHSYSSKLSQSLSQRIKTQKGSGYASSSRHRPSMASTGVASHVSKSSMPPTKPPGPSSNRSKSGLPLLPHELEQRKRFTDSASVESDFTPSSLLSHSTGSTVIKKREG